MDDSRGSGLTGRYGKKRTSWPSWRWRHKKGQSKPEG
nr:MAG TPA: hypothetical protein [Caudoviricetes sp.]